MAQAVRGTGVRRATILLTAMGVAFLVISGLTPMEPLAQEATGSTAANGRIAFHSYEAADADIYAMNPDGTGKINLTDEAPDAYAGADVEPAFSPDGTTIAFQSDRSGEYTEDPNWPEPIFDVWIVNADGSGQPRRLTTAEGQAPAWSPDGKQIAFSSSRDGNYEIWVKSVDGTGTPKQLTHTENTQEGIIINTSPSWSVDGKIAYMSNKDNPSTNQRDIYVANADGTGEPTRLTNIPTANNWAPEWSPDGKRIAFWRDQHLETCGPCDREVYVMDTVDSNGDGNGDNQTNLTNDPAMDYQPDWSPDGTQISFISNREDGEYSLWTVPAPQPASAPTPGVALLGAFFADAAFAQETTSGPTPVANSSGASSSDWAPNTPPKIWSKLLPGKDSTTADGTPVIGAKVTDAETELTRNNLALFLDGARVERAKWVYNPDNHRVRYVPASDLSSGVHKVKILARDSQGLVTRETWHFSVASV